MGRTIKKVAVLGAGVMGQGIAAHLANAGVPSVLYDIVPAGAAKSERSKLAVDGIENAKRLKPAAFYNKDDAALITPANYEDDAALLKDCDLIIEVVVELVAIKKKVFDWVAKHRAPGSILASNTSGIAWADMSAGMPAELRQHFLVMHFFNPVRYMRLLELVSGPDTLPEVTRAAADFGEKVLGKGIVYAKDTPAFVANRIGTYAICSVFKHMPELGLDIEAVDAIFGPPMGRPKSGVFRLADLVGLDTIDHVMANIRDKAAADEVRAAFVSPGFLKKMIEEGALGDKTGKGFYKKVKDGGKSVILARELASGEYKPAGKPRFDSIGAAKRAGDVGAGIKAMLAGTDAAAQLAWRVTADALIYAANRVPEIADDIVNVDRAMRWGFAWDLGPFESWDAIGVKASVERMKKDGRRIPGWIETMLTSGRESFYARDAEGRTTYWDPASASAKSVPLSGRWLFLKDRKEADAVVAANDSADLIDLGDGVLCLSFHSKMNALDAEIFALYGRALDWLDEGKWEALVVGNQGGTAFSAGANIFVIVALAMQQKWNEIGAMVKGMQDILGRAKYSRRPVVTAPWGLVLGGGAEVAMRASACQAGAELYMGLVEVGVGLLPAGGGCTEVLCRYLGGIPEGTTFDPNPFVQQAFKGIGMATVSMSAEEARGLGYLRPQDRLSLDPDALIQDAKLLALGMVKAGYRPPRKPKLKLPGPSGRAAIELFLYQMHKGGWASEHDLKIGRKIAYVMTGGDIPTNTVVGEQHVLDLEREAFISLCGEPKTQERIQHMLSTGKPLRN
ncbi:MAG: 3-hydroxyacyl-CoA dehydrogenase/enoyl-CoA hydratase family protein [Deltaproteobacteria bacterium]|nr:3-hydroxyacyl-CoA dehydrogenase/enoyl-CoA hydratase family protein [Deltaproteobacteria bacterium]